MIRTVRMKRSKAQSTAFWSFISPWLIGLILFSIIPLGFSLYYSFTFYTVFQSPKFIGFDNYKDIFEDRIFYKSLWNTFYFTAVKVVIMLSISLVIAFILNKKFRLRNFYRAAFYLPAIIPGVGAVMIWQYLYDKNIGLLNYMLGIFYLPAMDWFSVANAMNSIIVLSIWGAIGPTMVVLLAALQGVPAQYYEALEIDGGSTYHKFRHITLPLISPTLLYLVITGLITSLQVFAEPLLLTGGGPNYASNTLTLYIYQNAFDLPPLMGYACALAWIVFVITMTLSALLFMASKRLVYYEGTK